jgi:hypothetical protein
VTTFDRRTLEIVFIAFITIHRSIFSIFKSEQIADGRANVGGCKDFDPFPVNLPACQGSMKSPVTCLKANFSRVFFGCWGFAVGSLDSFVPVFWEAILCGISSVEENKYGQAIAAMDDGTSMDERFGVNQSIRQVFEPPNFRLSRFTDASPIRIFCGAERLVASSVFRLPSGQP